MEALDGSGPAGGAVTGGCLCVRLRVAGSHTKAPRAPRSKSSRKPRFCLSLVSLLRPASLQAFEQAAFSEPEGGEWGEPFDWTPAAVQYCCMTAIPVSKRGTITLPPEIRRALGLDAAEHPMMLVELRDGGVFLQPAGAMPVRDIPLETIQQWIAADERDAESFWKKAGKA